MIRFFNLLLSPFDKLAGRWLSWRADQAYKSVDPKTDVEIQRVEFSKEKGLEIVGTAPGITYLADECTELLKKFKADNYIQFDMMPRYDRGQKPVRVTVAFANGEMPAMRADRLSKQIENIANRMNTCHEHILDIVADWEDKLSDYEEGLNLIRNWAKAYPLSIFPEPDLQRARELLEAGGITLDAVSAGAIRSAVCAIENIVNRAFPDEEGENE